MTPLSLHPCTYAPALAVPSPPPPVRLLLHTVCPRAHFWARCQSYWQSLESGLVAWQNEARRGHTQSPPPRAAAPTSLTDLAAHPVAVGVGSRAGVSFTGPSGALIDGWCSRGPSPTPTVITVEPSRHPSLPGELAMGGTSLIDNTPPRGLAPPAPPPPIETTVGLVEFRPRCD